MNNYLRINDLKSLESAIERVKIAQQKLSSYSQAQIDEIFSSVAKEASAQRIPLARLASEETKMGLFEDKVIKNQLASEYVYNKYKNDKTCGVIEEDEILGIQKIACPIGIIGAVIPTTNPTSTAIFKILLALKTGNAIIISPHPRAKKCTSETARLLLESAVRAGAPMDIIAWIEEPSIELTEALMKHSDLILATGGAGMVKSAYSSGKPAIGVGAGNTPAIIDDSANIELAVSSIIHSKTFDNGLICASEQAVIVMDSVYDATRREFEKRGCYFLRENELGAVRDTIMINGEINTKIVGQDADKIAELSGVNAPRNTKILIGEVEKTDESEPFAHEKLSPVLAMYRANSFEKAIQIAKELIELGGLGHTSSIYIDEYTEKKKIDIFKDEMRTCRILINTPSSQGGVGDVYNFGLPPSLTLGCGSWGGNSVCENVGIKQLLNIKTLASRRENMLWLKAPEIFMKRGSFSHAFDKLSELLKEKRVFIVTDKTLFEGGYYEPISKKLSQMNAKIEIFYNIEPDPTLSSAREGAKMMQAFKPEAIIAFGGGSAMDCAKIMWLLYEHPNVEFYEIAQRFADIERKIYSFPRLKTPFIAIPTSAGTGSEVTPFAVITDNDGIKYPIADYELLPRVAIIDVDFQKSAPKSLIVSSGIDALTHALEAYVSVMATDFTDALALNSIKLIFENLPRVYQNVGDIEALERLAHSATMAGIAFANAFLGVCHSMAHKLGSFHHIPHGISNALLIEEVIRFNASDAPTKMGTFSQYTHPRTILKYGEIADALKINAKAPNEKLKGLISKIKELKHTLNIPNSIKELGISESNFISTLDNMAEQAFDDQCTGANPRYPLLCEIKQMYLNAYFGK